MSDLSDALEALLFVADVPLSLQTLSQVTNRTEGQVEQALEVLSVRLSGKGAIQLIQIAGGYQLVTKPEYADLVALFLKPQPRKLSRSLVEVLAVIAYKQPVTIGEVEQIRGVQSDYAVRALVERNLVKEGGKKRTPGRPGLYATTPQFLHEFRLNKLEDLPPVKGDILPAGASGLFEDHKTSVDSEGS